MMIMEKTYTFNLTETVIIAEDRTSKISFLLILDGNKKPKDPWVGQCISKAFINGRTFGNRRDYIYLDHLEEAAKKAAKGYLSRRSEEKKEKKENPKEIPYWQKPPFD